jgi:acyl carrier protein
MKTIDSITGDLAEILSNFQGREYSGTINQQTMFLQDLGFSSIDVVILGETLEGHYGVKLPFGNFISELAGQQKLDLNIGELALFLQKHID